MHRETYRRICQYCDQTIKHFNSVEILSTAFLHPIRPHPTFLFRYNTLFLDRHKYFFYSLYIYIRSFASGVLWLAKVNFIRLVFFRTLTQNSKIDADTILITHLTHYSLWNLEQTDAYFGDLVLRLRERNLKPFVLYWNQTKFSTKDLLKRTGFQANQIIGKHHVGVRDAFLLFTAAVRTSRRLKDLSKGGKRLQRRLNERASMEVFRSGSLDNLAFFHQLSRVIRVTKPASLFFTFEGHAWERLAVLAANRSHPRPKTVGYLHSIIFDKHHALLRSMGRELEPNVVLTSNKYATTELSYDKSRLLYQRIYTVGKDIQLLENDSVKTESRDNICIVIPEGISSEMLLLFTLALQCAPLTPNIQFKFRFHPLVNPRDFLIQNKLIDKLPPNVVISTGNLQSDLFSARWALYRGSSLIVQAVAAGVIPIYVSFDHQFSIDPLRSFSENPLVVTDQRELEEALSRADGEILSSIKVLESEARRNFPAVNWKAGLDFVHSD
jgi:hypothetical protein